MRRAHPELCPLSSVLCYRRKFVRRRLVADLFVMPPMFWHLLRATGEWAQIGSVRSSDQSTPNGKRWACLEKEGPFSHMPWLCFDGKERCVLGWPPDDRPRAHEAGIKE
jgi:hypothetical protein